MKASDFLRKLNQDPEYQNTQRVNAEEKFRAISEAKKIEEEIKGRGRNYKTTPAQYLTLKPSYFNSGCCCFRDGDITGIEITYEKIALVKWNIHKQRVVLEETTLNKLQEVL